MTASEKPPVDMDGSIKVIVHDPYGEHAITHAYSFNDIDRINMDPWGLRLSFYPDPQGRETHLTWPWQHILHIDHLTNGTEVSDKLQKYYEEKNLEQYTEHGMDILEKLLAGKIPNSEEDAHVHTFAEDGPKVAHGYETPCGHGEAVQSADAPIWTCLICANQWHEDVWAVE